MLLSHSHFEILRQISMVILKRWFTLWFRNITESSRTITTIKLIISTNILRNLLDTCIEYHIGNTKPTSIILLFPFWNEIVFMFDLCNLYMAQAYADQMHNVSFTCIVCGSIGKPKKSLFRKEHARRTAIKPTKPSSI